MNHSLSGIGSSEVARSCRCAHQQQLLPKPLLGASHQPGVCTPPFAAQQHSKAVFAPALSSRRAAKRKVAACSFRGDNFHPSGSSSTPSATSTPRPLDRTASQQLLNHLRALTPHPPPSTPLSPFMSLLVTGTSSSLQQWSPSLLLKVLQLCNWTGYTPSSGWLASWASAVKQQLPRLSSDVACRMVAELLKTRHEALPQGVLDDLFIGALKDVEGTSSSSMAAALVAIATAELSVSREGSASSSVTGNLLDGSRGPSVPGGFSRSAAVIGAATVSSTQRPPPAAVSSVWRQPQPDAADTGDLDAFSAALAAASEKTVTASAADDQPRPGSFASLVGTSNSSSDDASSSNSSSKHPPVGPLSSWQDLAAAAADLKPNAAAATAAQQSAYAAEAAAAGAAAVAQGSSNNSRQGVNIQDLAASAGLWQSTTSSNKSGTAAVAEDSSVINGSSSSSSAANIMLADWLGGYERSSNSSKQQPSDLTQLHPIALHSWMLELSQPGRMQQLQPDDLAAVAAAAAALQLKIPGGWLDRFTEALQRQFGQISSAGLSCLGTCLPLLMPSGGSLRVWRRLESIIQQQGNQLSAGQLCEVLPLVEAADLAVPTNWVEKAISKIQGSLPNLSLPQASRALVSAVALGYKPPKPWLDTYMQRFRAGLSELNPEGLVDVLRALAAAGALPSHEWLLDFERDVGRRFGFIGPVELSTTAFLFANLAHIPSKTWKQRFMSEALKFRVYYTGGQVTQVVWSAVRMGCKPDPEWLMGYAAQMREQLKTLEAFQLAFTVAALHKLGASLESEFTDEVLDAYALQLQDAQPSDTALLLVTVAQLQHVSSYRWLEDVLDSCQTNMLQYDGQELVTLLWSLAKLHHQPGHEWLHIFCEAVESQLPRLTGSQLAQLLYGFAQLQWEPPAGLMQAYLDKTQACLAAAEMSGRDAASLLSSLAILKRTPSEPWLHACLSLLFFRLPELDPEGLATVAISLAKLHVMVGNGQWLENYVSLTLPRLSAMSVQTQVNLLSALAVFGTDLPRAWVAAFQLICVQQAEARTMSADQLEQVLVALCSRGYKPSSALCQLYYDASLPELAQTSPSSIAAILQAMKQAAVVPDAHWLEVVVDVVRDKLGIYNLLQLKSILTALMTFQAAGSKQRWLSDFVSYLREFLL